MKSFFKNIWQAFKRLWGDIFKTSVVGQQQSLKANGQNGGGQSEYLGYIIREESSLKDKPHEKIGDSSGKNYQEKSGFGKSMGNRRPKGGTKSIENPIANTWADDPRFRDKLRIGYSPAYFTNFSKIGYPIVKMPRENALVKPPVAGRANNVGITEPGFQVHLTKYFPRNVFNHLSLISQYNCYEPDFAFIYLDGGKNIFIDLEIDEPYEGVGRQPTHFVGVDLRRDTEFTERGWIVLRFSEKQIFTDPKGCCRYLADLIRALDPTYRIPAQLTDTKPVAFEQHWTKKQAEQWALENYREKYLGIEGFYESATGNPRKLDLKDSPIGRQIEEEIKSNKSRTNLKPQDGSGSEEKKFTFKSSSQPAGGQRPQSTYTKEAPKSTPSPITYGKKTTEEKKTTQVPPTTFG